MNLKDMKISLNCGGGGKFSKKIKVFEMIFDKAVNIHRIFTES